MQRRRVSLERRTPVDLRTLSPSAVEGRAAEEPRAEERAGSPDDGPRRTGRRRREPRAGGEPWSPPALSRPAALRSPSVAPVLSAPTVPSVLRSLTALRPRTLRTLRTGERTRSTSSARGGRSAARGTARPLTGAAAGLLVVAVAALGVVASEPLRRVVPAPGALVVSSAPSSADSAGSASLPPGTTPGEAARVSALTALLERRADALLARDVEGWMAPVADGAVAAGYAARQREVFENLEQVPLASWRWEYVGVGDALTLERAAQLGGSSTGAAADPATAPAEQDGGAGPWVARVVLVYELRDGGDEVRREQHLTLVPQGSGEGAGWRLASDEDGPTAVDLWDLGPVQVARGERSVVIGTGEVDPYVEVVDESAARVDAVWGTAWPRTSLVEVPATQAELARLLGRADAASLRQIAAVTTGETVGEELATTGDRVVVNPEAFDRLGVLGRQVIMTHELTHVATRASTEASVPIWLAEGYADWVGYLGSDLSRRTVAAPLLAAVREGRGPVALATAEDFDPGRGDVASAYAGSWLAVDMLAREHGEEAVTAFYRAVATAGPVAADLALAHPNPAEDEAAAERLDVALRAHFGTDEAGLVDAWRVHLAQLSEPERDAAPSGSAPSPSTSRAPSPTPPSPAPAGTSPPAPTPPGSAGVR